VTQAWRDWAETTQCDSAGRLTMYGIQALVMRTIVESGEILIRRRWRLPEDKLAVPMQLQVLEPDFLDAGRNGILGDAGGPIIQGVEFDAIGRRVAYWLFDRHPGSLGAFGVGAGSLNALSQRVSAADVLHVFDQERAGQVRGPSWFASVDVRLHDFAQFEDATLMKQKIAACMAAFVTDPGDGTAAGLAGTDSKTGLPTETFEPGMILSLPPGKEVTVANPPPATDHQSYSACSLRGIAAGLGVTYEDLTGDYSQVNYSSGRMGRLAHQADVHHWRWNMLIPQFCAPVWGWMQQALTIVDAIPAGTAAPAEWHPAPMAMLDVDKESKAYQQRVRNGQMTWPQMIRELGEDPDALLAEIAAFNQKLDKLGIALDCDPRRMTAAGGVQQVWTAGSIAQWPPPPAPETLPTAPGAPAAKPASKPEDAPVSLDNEGDSGESDDAVAG
jgi:lambda family phage portal protein